MVCNETFYENLFLLQMHSHIMTTLSSAVVFFSVDFDSLLLSILNCGGILTEFTWSFDH